MNAAFLLMTSACLAGADFQPPAAAAAPVAATAPCGGCASSCDPCQRVCLLDKIKARLHTWHRHGCCEAAPTCHPCYAAPAPTCHPCHAPRACAPACGTPLFKGTLFHKKDSCGGGCSGACDACPKASLLDKIKAKLSCKKPSCDSGCSAPCGGCGAAPAMAAPGGSAPVPMGGAEKKQS